MLCPRIEDAGCWSSLHRWKETVYFQYHVLWRGEVDLNEENMDPCRLSETRVGPPQSPPDQRGLLTRSSHRLRIIHTFIRLPRRGVYPGSNNPQHAELPSTACTRWHHSQRPPTQMSTKVPASLPRSGCWGWDIAFGAGRRTRSDGPDHHLPPQFRRPWCTIRESQRFLPNYYYYYSVYGDSIWRSRPEAVAVGLLEFVSSTEAETWRVKWRFWLLASKRGRCRVQLRQLLRGYYYYHYHYYCSP